ncbi:hypothetical protein PsYK624_015580 [Phanerochaete sordida]|uniref:AMP-dependent synthetase/ligase domain-containing protein n=1 Tax=Phanerochaete sordida TaxID=48140 RepID=A0A9P3L8G2_9APHY|nr:hypothetical protein PsYK624_015580 [Phanerochaete sordida]
MSVTEDARAQHFLSLLVPAFTKYAGKAIIRPFLRGQPARWGEVTFREWSLQLAAARLYWLRVLPELGLQPADVVGLWLTGKEYTDLLNISSVSAAGYVPQLFSPVFTSGMIHTLLNRSNACGLIYDPRVARDVAGCLSNIPTTTALNAESLSALVASCGRGLSEEDLPFVGERQTAAIFHSSGTTCGLPKLIPTSHLLLRVFITEKFPDCSLDNTQDSSNIFNSLGSLAHVGSFQAFHGAAALGCTTVQASSMAMGSTELRDMVRETGLNRLVQYGTFVAAHIRAAMTDPELAGVLRGLRQVLYTGVALGREEERWAREQGVRLMAMYGTSETGMSLCLSFKGIPG